MRSLRMLFVSAALVSTVVLATTPVAKSGEKRCRTITPCSQPTPVTCAAASGQSSTATQTCCQPAVASVQPQIELVAYARPASPRRLTPQPDALDIRRTTAETACAWYMVEDYGSYQLYYGTRCSDDYPIPIYASGLDPLPGDCGSPNGACVSFGSSVVPTAFNPNSTVGSGSVIQKGVHLTQKQQAGREPRNPPNASAKGPHKLKERSRVGEPIYAKFVRPGRNTEFVIVELQKYFVRGTGKSSQEISGTLVIGTEVSAVPAGKQAQEIDRQNIQIVADHVARLKIGNATYDTVTATKLAP